MKQRFTQLIAQASQARRVLISSFAVVAVLAAAIYAYAAVGVTVNGGTIPQTVTVSADRAANSQFPVNGTFTSLGDIVILEGADGDFRVDGSLILTAPAGWTFRQTGVTTVTENGNPNTGSQNKNVTINNNQIQYSATTITIPFTVNNTNQPDRVTIRGIEIQAVNGGNIPGAGTIILGATAPGGNSSVVGLPRNIVSVSQAVGAARGLAFRQQPTNTAIGAAITPAPQVAVVDQFGNTVTTGPGATSSVSVAIGANPGGGTLSGNATVTATGGIATFNGLSIDLPGAGYTLVASSGSLTSATSNTFNINNQRPTITSVAPECISQGDPATTLTITGTNFGAGAVVIINGTERPATVASRTSLTTTVTETELASAATLSIVVRNPTGPPHNGLESEVFSKTVVPLLTPGEVTGTASVCVNSTGNYSIAAVAGATSYQWTVVSGPATITAGATAATATLAFGEEAGTVVLSVTALNACGKPGAPANFTVAVNAFPVAEIEASGLVEFCAEGTVQLNVTPVEGASYQWQLNGADIEDAIGTSFVADASGNYRVVVTTNGCATNSNIIEVIENPLPVVTLNPLEAVCVSAAPFALTGGAPANGDYSGPGVVDGQFNPAVAGVGDHEITYTFINGNGCTNTATQTIIVKALPEVTVSPNTEVCAGERTTLTASGATTYRWEPTIGIEGPTTGASINVRPTETTTYTVYGTTDGCESVAQTVTVVVNPLPNVTVTPIGPTEFCPNNWVELGVPNVAGYDYQWFSTASETPVGNTSSYQATTTGTYYVTVTTDKGCELTSTPIAVKVADVPDEATILVTGSTTFCEGGFVTFSANQAPAGQTYLYQWEFSENGTDYAPIAGAQNRDYEAEDAGFYRVVVSNTNVEDEDTQLCTKTSLPQEVTVLPQPTASIVSPAPAATTICQNSVGTTSFTVTGTYSGIDGLASWTSNNTRFSISGRNDVVNSVTGVTTSTVTVNVSGSGTATITLEARNTTAACNTATSTITLTVQPQIAGNTITGTNAYCQEATATALRTVSTLSGGTGSFNYRWEQSIDQTTWDPAAGTNNAANYTPSTANVGIMHYRRVVTSGTCTSTSNTITVTVNPNPTVNAVTNKIYCNGEAGEAITFGSPIDGVTYSWSSSANVGFGTSGDGNIGAYTATNTGTAPVTATIRVRASANNCQGPEHTFTITVNPTPTVNTIANRTHCNGAAGAVISFSSPVSGATYSWTSSADVGFGTSGDGNIGAYTAINTGTAPITATVTVRASANNCQGPERTFTVTVNPTPRLSSTLTPAAICSGATFSYTPTSATDGASFSWTRLAATGITSPGSATGTGSINQTLTNSGTAPVDVTYQIITGANGCASATQNVVVRVNPTPTLSNTSTTATVCSGSVFNYTATTATANTSFSWSRAAVTGISNPARTNVPGNVISETLLNTTASAINVVYVISMTANGCPSTQNVTVSVSPNQVVSFTGTIATTDVFYTGQAPINLSATPAGGTFSGPGVSGSVAAGFTFSPCAAGPGNHTITYTRTTGGCISSVSKTVTVNQSTYRAVITANPHPFCRGAGGSEFTATIYRDIEEGDIIYPYLVNGNGQPVDEAGNLISEGRGTFPVPNTKPVSEGGYPFPSGTPESIMAMSYRFFQPIVRSGLQSQIVSSSNFDYQWQKNDANDRKNNAPVTSDAGLSSQDYYSVEVTSKSGALCAGTTIESNRIYSAVLEDYTVALTANPNPICQGGAVTFTATLNERFPWSTAQLQLDFVLTRGNVVLNPSSFTYTGSTTITFTTDAAAIGGFVNGDQVVVRFSTNVTPYLPNSNCIEDPAASPVTIAVNDIALVPNPTPQNPVICLNGTATFTAPVTTTGPATVTYTWTVGSRTFTTTVPTLNISTQVSSTAGSYPVSVVVSNACETTSTIALGTLTVKPALAQFTVSGGGSYCQGSPVALPISLSGSQTGVNYTLVRGTTTVQTLAGTGGVLNFTPVSTTGTYTVRAAYATPPTCGPVTMTGSASIVANPLPTVTVNSPTTCENAPVTVTAVPSGGTGPYTYTWTVPGGFANPGNVASFQTTVAGTYTVRVADSRNCASSAAATSTVTVNPRPTVSVNSPTVCAGETATVIASATGGLGPYTYTWTVPSGFDNPGNVASFPTTVAGTYSVIVTDSRSCSSSEAATSTVTVNPIRTSRASLYIENEQGEITAANPILPGEWLKITALSDIEDEGAALSYEWSIGNDVGNEWNIIKTNREDFLIIDPVEPGEFNVRVRITPNNNGVICFDPVLLITTEPLVPLPVEIIYFTAAKQGNNVLLEWATASEENNTGFEVQVSQDGFNFRKLDFVPTKNGNTVIKQVYQYTDKENGKRGTRYYRLKQIDEDGRFEYFTTKAVTFSEVASKVKAFPNPFTTKITLDIAAENSGQVQVTMWNAVGRQLMEQNVVVEEGFNTVNLDIRGDLPHGVYFLRVYLDGKMHQIKMLRE